VRLKTLLPSAFGKFHVDAPIVLSGGLNIIRGENEAGKSTLGAFILGMFYGFKKEGKTRISRSPEFDRYKPWSGNDYRGAVTYEEGGRVYRVERSFEPDAVRIYDDSTGEDVTRSFSQDSRKEYDFALRHLGLSQKEFRNTVWIGQLGSQQEPGLGTEIQGKLESILQGGAEDVSLGRALAALSEERAKIKSPRSSKARLDVLGREIEGLERELGEARDREDQVREWLLEASDLGREKAGLQSAVEQGEKDLKVARYSLLQGVLLQVQELESRAESLRANVRAVEWAHDLDPGCEETFRTVSHEKEAAQRRIAEIEEEARGLVAKREGVVSRLQSLRAVDACGVDEAGLASLHQRYVSAKALASKSERAANDARKDLRAAEEEGKAKGYPSIDLDQDILRNAEEYQETYLLAQRERDRLEIEMEKARSAAVALRPGAASALLYALALVILGVAVVSTFMGIPLGVPAFAVAVAVFAFGVYRHRSAILAQRQAESALSQKEQEVAEQATRVESAGKVLSEYLAALGVKSVEELRGIARDIASYRARLKAAKDRFEEAQDSWFEASGDFSTVEKELVAVTKAAGALPPGEAATDMAIDALRRKLRELASEKQALKILDERLTEVSDLLAQQKGVLAAVSEKESRLLAAAGTGTGEDLLKKISDRRDYQDLSRTLQETTAREQALLSGRNASDIQGEMAALCQEMGTAPFLGIDVSERDYEAGRKAQDERKARLGDATTRLAVLEKGIRLKSEEGRPSSVIEEELERKRALEEELAEERDALDLAYETLTELSASIRREFAPVLNRRVGQILSEITLGRYTQIRVSPDLEMSVIHPDTGTQAPIGALSGGTLDQCYFALRVAIAEAVTKTEEFPFFLDDSFVQYDDRRLGGALSILATLAGKHQMLVFSCHGREEEIARRTGLEYNRVAL
jgi:uncharacterized protein YhaN